MLRRGALAVVGHVDRAYGYSFVGSHLDAQTSAFEDCLAPVLDGLPVGFGLEGFAQLAGDMGAALAHQRDEIAEYFERAFPEVILPPWAATIDAGAFVIAGDPAARFGARR